MCVRTLSGSSTIPLDSSAVQYRAMEHLSKLFGSPARMKVMRLFVFNPERVYDRDLVATAVRVSPDAASRECAALARMGIITRRSFYREVPEGSRAKRRKVIGWVLDQGYPHLAPLSAFLRDTVQIETADMRRRFRGVGTVHLLVLAGSLAGNPDSEVDLLIVGDRLRESAVRTAVRMLEAECGRDLRYLVLSTKEYLYRRRVRDRLVRDVMDFPHREIVDKLRGA